jgi:glycosyltransferase involved in cell wall biosynthesis
MKVALVYDVSGWAFHRIAVEVARYNRRMTFVPLSRDEWKAADQTRFVGVHFFWWHDALLSLPRLTIPFTVSFHGPIGVLDTDAHDKKLERILSLASGVASVCQSVADGIEAKFGVQSSVIHEGVDLGLFHPSLFRSREFTVGWTGNRLITGHDDYKGVKLIRAAVESIPGCVFKEAARNDKWRTAEEMAEWYSGIDLYCCASIAEGNPKPVQEALACGRPFISTAVGVAPLLVEQSVDLYGVACGRIVERTVDGIRSAVEWYVQDLNRVRVAGAAGRGVIERWTWKDTADGYRALVCGAFPALAEIKEPEGIPIARKPESRATGRTVAQGRRRRVLYVPCDSSWSGPRSADDLRAAAFAATGSEVRVEESIESAARAVEWADLAIYGNPIKWAGVVHQNPKALDSPHAVTLHGYALPQISPLGIHGDARAFLAQIPFILLTSECMDRMDWPTRHSWLPNPAPEVKVQQAAITRADRPPICIGTLSTLKGADRVSAWLRANLHRAARWAGAGVTNLWHDGRHIARTHPQRLQILGGLDRQELKRQINQSPLLLHLSHMESCPMAVLECMAQGRPAIVSAAGDMPDMVKGSGIVAGDDVEAAVVTMLDTLDERSQAAVESARAMSAESFSGRYGDLMARILDDWPTMKRHGDAATIRSLLDLSWYRCRFTGVEQYMYGHRNKGV